jgi:energy-coupling factor transporter ATP-binding protein EcfA2
MEKCMEKMIGSVIEQLVGLSDPQCEKLNDNFKLPISYLKNKTKLEDHVINDLELKETVEHKSLYECIFTDASSYNNNINISFAKTNLSLWASYYTSDTRFLKETQRIILSEKFPRTIQTETCVGIKEMWDEIEGETGFESKYKYLDWDFLKKLNSNTTFLQCMTMYNVSSPVISLIVPVILMIIPFFILKIQGVDITISKYKEVIKTLLSKHQLGGVFEIGSASHEKRVYIIVSLIFYLFQIYQNVLSCYKFILNMKKIHSQLFEMRDYVSKTIDNMEQLQDVCENHKRYKPFIQDMNSNKKILREFLAELDGVSALEINYAKIANIGHSLKCFYLLYKNTEYKNAIHYSFGLNGYIHNINQLKQMIVDGNISKCSFTTSAAKNKSKFKNAFFPSLIGKNPVKNSYGLKKNMLITGPNAAGKTTLLKTTIFNIILSQQIGFGCYDSAIITPFDKIHCYINIPDSSERDSLFQAEARRCKNILTAIGSSPNKKERHFCVFDELYSGTNPYEAIASATSFLGFLNKNPNISYVITTHFLEICSRLEKDEKDKVSNVHMDIKTNDEMNDFIYTYNLKNGISKVKGGIKVLRDLEYPKEIIENTQRIIDSMHSL